MFCFECEKVLDLDISSPAVPESCTRVLDAPWRHKNLLELSWQAAVGCLVGTRLNRRRLLALLFYGYIGDLRPTEI
jgi:hypothetical protein